MQARVEADEIHQLEWAHGMVQAQLECFVYVGGGSDPLLQHVEGFVADHGVDAAGDEAGRLLDHHHFFAHALANFGGSGQSVFVGFKSANDFEQLHLVHGIEKMHAHTSLCPVGHAGDLGDAERRSIRRENRRGPADFVEEGEDLDL